MKKWIYIIGAFLLLWLALFYSLSSVNKNEAISLTKSATVTKGKIQKTITLIGQIAPSKIMSVNSSITGKIIEKKYELGDSVITNEVLLTIKPDQEKYIDYLQKKSSFYQAKIDFTEKMIEYDNSKELFKSHFIQEDELRKNKNAYEIAKMKLDINTTAFEIYKSKYNIDEKSIFKIIPITAPLTGIITEDNVEEGNYIKSALSEYNEGTVICVIGNFDNLKANFSIAEEYLPILRKAKNVKMKNNKGKNIGFGKIVKISPLGNSDKGYISFNFSVEFNSPKKRMFLGTSVKVEIIVVEKNSCLRVPIQAISFDSGQAFVNFKNGKSTKRKDIKIGIVGNRFIEILDGVLEGEKLDY